MVGKERLGRRELWDRNRKVRKPENWDGGRVEDLGRGAGRPRRDGRCWRLGGDLLMWWDEK